MTTIYIAQPLVINQFSAHKELKEHILRDIANTEAKTITYKDCEISRTDYSCGGQKPYQDILKEPLVKHMKWQMQQIGYSELIIHNMWFQQYEHNSSHNWHVHHNCQWTNVYYVELDHNNPRTEIYDRYANKIREVPVWEGCILTMPSQLIHRAPHNLSNTRKTIISFNTCTPTQEWTI